MELPRDAPLPVATSGVREGRCRPRRAGVRNASLPMAIGDCVRLGEQRGRGDVLKDATSEERPAFSDAELLVGRRPGVKLPAWRQNGPHTWCTIRVSCDGASHTQPHQALPQSDLAAVLSYLRVAIAITTRDLVLAACSCERHETAVLWPVEAVWRAWCRSSRRPCFGGSHTWLVAATAHKNHTECTLARHAM